MTFEIYTGGLVSTNAYLLQKGESVILVDAPQGVLTWAKDRGLSPDVLLLTHQHFDHVEDAALFNGPIYSFAACSRDLILDQGARDWGLPVTVADFEVTHLLEKEVGSQLSFENKGEHWNFDLLHVPGHSPDSLVYSLPEEKIALVGDTLFQSGIGRTDLPGGDEALLIEGIQEKLLTLPPDSKLYPGHGPHTTPAEEQNNPFLNR